MFVIYLSLQNTTLLHYKMYTSQNLLFVPKCFIVANNLDAPFPKVIMVRKIEETVF